MHRAAKAYLETKVTTTSQGQVLLMLYDGAVTFLEQAKERIVAKDYAQKGILISKALDIISELSSSLNMEKGGELAANLARLYIHCNKQLFQANLKMNTALIDDVIGILGGLRSAYAQIVNSPEAIAALAGASASQPTMHSPNRMPIAPQAAGTTALASASRAQGAYAQQRIAAESMVSQAPVAVQPKSTPPAYEATLAPAPVVALSAEKAMETIKEDTIPPAKPEAQRAALPLLPDLDEPASPPPSLLASNKRLASSSLYRKFTS